DGAGFDAGRREATLRVDDERLPVAALSLPEIRARTVVAVRGGGNAAAQRDESRHAGRDAARLARRDEDLARAVERTQVLEPRLERGAVDVRPEAPSRLLRLAAV